MNFDSEWLWMAFDQSLLEEVDNLRAGFGSPAMDGNKEIPDCLICGWDDEARTKKRGMVLDVTVDPIPLKDGRFVIGGLWNLDLKEAWEAGEIQAQALTADQLASLRVQAAD